MKTLSAQQIAEILGVSIAAGDAAVMVSGGVSTDTRTLAQGAAFFALRGENFDGDQFARKAIEGGASLVVVHSWEGEAPAGGAVIVVSDTLMALQRLACWWRKQLDLAVVGITGSNGKTSTKDFTRAVLSRKFNVCSTRGNLNNHIGVPLSVLSANEDHTAAVWEMGMNHSGEIAPLCEIAKPKYGIITNIGTAHIEFLGSRDAIADEKGVLARSLPNDGILFLPAICEYYSYFRGRTKAAVVPVGNGRGLVRAEQPVFELDRTIFNVVIEGEGTAEVVLPVPGKHMITNALLAAGAGWKLGMSVAEIAEGLSSVVLTGGRLNRYESRGVQVIDDTYNANPESMLAAIDTLVDLPTLNGSKKFIVLGRMGELGKHAEDAHLKVGRAARESGLNLIAVGEGAEGIAVGGNAAPYFPVLQDAAEWLSREVRSGDVVLFKGSRTATVEKVMNSAFPQN